MFNKTDKTDSLEKSRFAGKIAITATGGSLDALLSEQFGRCQYFIIYDTESLKFEPILNPGEQVQSGAGPKAAELIINKGAKILLTGHIGDKAEEALKRGGIKIVDGFKGTMKVKDVVNKFMLNSK